MKIEYKAANEIMASLCGYFLDSISLLHYTCPFNCNRRWLIGITYNKTFVFAKIKTPIYIANFDIEILQRNYWQVTDSYSTLLL